MRYLTLAFTLVISFHALGNEYKIREKKFYGGESIELYSAKDGGVSFSRVLELVEPNDQQLTIRILDPIDENASDELLVYLKREFPLELDKALESNGNLHNPALLSLNSAFIPAFQTTSEFIKYESALSGHGYNIRQVTYEKLTVVDGNIYVAEISISCERGT